MRVHIICPKNQAWLGPGRSELYVRLLEAEGIEATLSTQEHRKPIDISAESGVDVVINHACHVMPSLIEMAASRNPGIQFVNVNHSSGGHAPMSMTRLQRICQALDSARKLPNVWYATQERNQPIIEQAFYLPIPVIPVSRIGGYSYKKTKVFMAGRPDPVKNHFNEVQGFHWYRQLYDKTAELHVFIKDPTVVQWAAGSLGMDPKSVIFHSRVEHNDWIAQLQNADCLLQCSFSESFNNAACEAIQLGVPVISGVGVIRFNTENQCNNNDPSDIARKIANRTCSDRLMINVRELVTRKNTLYVKRIKQLIENPESMKGVF